MRKIFSLIFVFLLAFPMAAYVRSILELPGKNLSAEKGCQNFLYF